MLKTHAIKISSGSKTLLLNLIYTLILFFIIFLSLALPRLASHFPLPSHVPPEYVVIYIFIWVLALTPVLFFVGFVAGACYYYQGWRADKGRKGQQEYRAKTHNTQSTDAHPGTRKPQCAAAHFSPFQVQWRKPRLRIGMLAGKGEPDVHVLWDAEAYELEIRTRRGLEELERAWGVNRSESGLDERELEGLRRVSVREIV